MTTENLKSLTIWISGSLAQTSTSPNWAVRPTLPLIHMKLCLCRHNSTGNSGHNSVDWNTIDSVDSEADLVDTTVFVLLCRDPRLVPMTYGPQALYRPADNSLGRLRVTISQVLCVPCLLVCASALITCAIITSRTLLTCDLALVDFSNLDGCFV